MSKTVRLNVMMFLQFFVWGSFFVPMGKLPGGDFCGSRRKLEHDHREYLLDSDLGSVFCPADRRICRRPTFQQGTVNGVLHLLGAAMLWWCSTITDSPTQFFWAMLVFFLCYMPTLALVNAITFQNVDSIENDFPKIRLWGTIGWIVAGLVVSESMFGLFSLPVLPGIENAGARIFLLKLAAIVSVIYGLYSFTLPKSPPQGGDKPVSVASSLGSMHFVCLRNPATWYLRFVRS